MSAALASTLEGVSAFGALLSGAAAWRAQRKVRHLEGTNPWPHVNKAKTERDEALRENVRLRAQCRRLLRECEQLKHELSRALREIVRLSG